MAAPGIGTYVLKVSGNVVGVAPTPAAGRSTGGLALEERPAEVESRKNTGHREADTMHGSNRSGSLPTPVERKTGITLSAYLKDRTKETIGAAIVNLFYSLRARTHTLTFDNGKEFCGHRQVAEQLGCNTYCARPYHSRERGTTE